MLDWNVAHFIKRFFNRKFTHDYIRWQINGNSRNQIDLLILLIFMICLKDAFFISKYFASNAKV